jgi:hypothetical protein
MAKIIQINEKQYQTILESVNKRVIKEDSEDIFRVNVPLTVEGPNKIEGRYIDVEPPKFITITFQIEVSYKSWGIDDIQIWNIRGPRQLVLDYSIEPEEEYDENGDYNDYEEHEHSLILDWDNQKLKYHFPEERSNLQTRIDSIELELDESLFVKEINVHIG